MIWSDLSDAQRESILKRSASGESDDMLAAEFGLVSSSLSRKLRLLRSQRNNVKTYLRKTRMIHVTEPTKVFVFGDTHFGDEDQSALKCAIDVAKWFQPQIIINLGDTLDCHVLSSFKKDPSAATLEEERSRWFEFSEKLDEVLESPAKKYILRGNHDERFETWLRTYGGEIASLSEMTLDGLLATDALGWEPIVDELLFNPRGDDLYPDPELTAIHGEKARTHAGNSARSASDMYSGASVIVGHAHRSAMYSKRISRGVVRSYEVGTLANLDPEYAVFPDWSQSVMTGVIDLGYHDFWHHMIDRGYCFVG